MAQERYWNFRDDDLTFRLDQWLLGILKPGLYKGFDAQLNSTLTFQLVQTITGHQKTLKDNSLTNALGIYITKQGVVVTEDEPIEITVNASGANGRIDYIIAEHNYLETEGGVEALYKVVEGPADGSAPTLTDPNVQIILGTLTLPANTNSLLSPGVAYVKGVPPELGGSENRYVTRDGGSLISSLNAANNQIRNLAPGTANTDAINLQQLNDREQDILNSIVQATTEIQGKIELATQSEVIQGIDNERAVTAATLQGKTASQTRLGILRLATLAEALAGTSTVLGITPKVLLDYLLDQNYIRDAQYTHTDNNFTDLLLAKLNGIQAGAEVNVNADWNATSGDANILNKPRVADRLLIRGNTLSMRTTAGVIYGSVTLPDNSIDERNIEAFSIQLVIGGDGDISGGPLTVSSSFSYNVNLSSAFRPRVVQNTGNRTAFRLYFDSSFKNTNYACHIEFNSRSASGDFPFRASTLHWSTYNKFTSRCDFMIREDTSTLQNVRLLVYGKQLKR